MRPLHRFPGRRASLGYDSRGFFVSCRYGHHSLARVLGLDSRARMNLPGKADGNWQLDGQEWRGYAGWQSFEG